MFGAPHQFGRRTPMLPRLPGVGDHVCVCGVHVGLIVDVKPNGLATVARRTTTGGVVEVQRLIDRLTIMSVAPLTAAERRDPEWVRGRLG